MSDHLASAGTKASHQNLTALLRDAVQVVQLLQVNAHWDRLVRNTSAKLFCPGATLVQFGKELEDGDCVGILDLIVVKAL
mmetsp:Transcript_13428/g.48865  ORF Transcript_13428/g.48865 Transcript_13428/m.48865 type:complete len:80 (-) Transcript_13428:120-359(-)